MVTSGGTGRNDDHSSRSHSREARRAASAPCSVSNSTMQVRMSFPASSKWQETKPGMSRTMGMKPFSARSEEHTSELQSRLHLVCRLLLEKKKTRRRENDA